MKGPPETDPANRLLEAVARVLMPLVRLLIARGVTYQGAAEMLKRVYVLAAKSQMPPGDEATGTRLSLLTGLNRKEIKRLTEEGDTKPVELEGITSHAAAIHAVWTTVRRFREKNGAPRVLPLRSRDRQPSFDELVRNITTDHRPAALLEELVRLELVAVDEEGNVGLLESPFLSKKTFGDKLVPMAENLEDHCEAAVSNVLGQGPFLERSVFSDELSEESAAELHELVRQRWKQVHDDLIARAIELEKQDKQDGKVTQSRIRTGMYFYSQTKDRK